MKKFLSVFLIVIAVSGFLYYYKENKDNKYDTKIENVEYIPDRLLKQNNSGIKSNGSIEGVVERVTDGDTLSVNYKNKEYKVRLLDVDTPESVKQGVAVQEFSKEASEFTKSIASGKEVRLVFEKETKDRYERLLAHVFIKNQKLSYLNGLLVRNGFARTEVLSPNSVYKSYFEDLQQEAINENKGFWSLPEKQRPFIKVKNSYVPAYKVTN